MTAKPPALPARLGQILCLDDFEAAARRHLPAPVFAYVSGGVERNQTLRANAQAFERLEFVTRVLVDTSKRFTETALLGRSWAAPFGIAPMGICALSAYRGDLVLARAALHDNVPMILSGSSLIRMEEVRAANPHAWFQAYLPGAEAEIVALIERVKAAGYETLVVTLDASIASNREQNIRAGFSTPLRPSIRLAWQGLTHPRWTFGTFLRTVVQHGMPHFENNYARRGAPILSASVLRDFSDRGHLDWDHLRMIRRMWPGALVVKGIARRARRTPRRRSGCRRHHRFQPRRAPARRHGVTDARVVRHRRGMPERSRHGGQRFPPWHRRDQGTRAGREVRVRREAVQLCGRGRR